MVVKPTRPYGTWSASQRWSLCACLPVQSTGLPEWRKEKRLIEELPFVKGDVVCQKHVVKANLNKVRATVTCCWESGNCFKRVTVACDEKEKPTHLEALMALRAKLIKEHGTAEHVPDPRAVLRLQTLEAQGDVTAPEPTAFDRLRLAQAAQQRAQAQVKIEEQAVAKAAAAELEAARVREAAEAELKAWKARAAALELPKTSHKKQRTAFGAVPTPGNSSEGDAATSDAAATQAEETDDEPTWLSWALSRWRKHETEVQARREEPVNDTDVAEAFPPCGDESRGWRHHWRRGLVGTLQDWAAGSKFKVAFMLAVMTIHFKCEQLVSAPLAVRFDSSPIPVPFQSIPVHPLRRLQSALVSPSRRSRSSRPRRMHTSSSGCALRSSLNGRFS